ncbi:MAG: hypothetical protein IKW89_02370 [Bacteroidales bacterium]|nr:hypothetical protein [Bacteroidales bacterium]
MIRKNITQSELLDAVCRYEKEVRNTDFLKESEVQRIYLFKAVRRAKLVIIIPSGLFSTVQDELIRKAEQMIIKDVSLSENIDFYTAGVITETRAEELETPLRKQGVSISFFDSTKMETISQFHDLMDKDVQHEADGEIDPSFFDYLALSNDSSDIKNGFFYSLVLMEIYRHQPVSENDIYDLCQIKYGRQKSDINLALKSLRKRGKITPPKAGGVFSLTDNEMRLLEKASKESKSEELAFRTELERIVTSFGFSNCDVFLDFLKKEYLAKYSLLSKTDDDGEEQENEARSKGGIWDSLFKGLSDEEATSLRQELNELCAKTDYLDQYGLIHSFLDLFRSDRYEDYIKQKENCIYVDTPVIAYYICDKSSFQDKYHIEWDNIEFLSAHDLFGYLDESKDNVKLYIPHDYLQEAIGEMKKALQFNWFNQFPNLPIPVETANTFFNYYQEVKKQKKQVGDSIEQFTLESFAKQMGFVVQNPQAADFFVKNIASLRFFLDKLGCETLDKVDVNHNTFDKVKEDYYWVLREKGKYKSELAIKADVRQSVHLTERVKETKNNEREYFLVSWDQTLYSLRNKAKDEMEIAGRSYSIFKPRELAEKIAFRRFKISKDSINNEVFAYASSSFNVKDKIRSLYDNVLNPYFASMGKSNGALVLEVLKMQKASIEGEVETPKDDKTAFENIFLSIITELPKHYCSTQNLKDYLNDEENNATVIPLFAKAFDDYRKGKTVDIAKQLCEMVKAYVSKGEKEIVL